MYTVSTRLHNRQDIPIYTPLITKVLIASSLRNSFTMSLQTTHTVEREDYKTTSWPRWIHVIGVTAAFGSSLTANKTHAPTWWLWISKGRRLKLFVSTGFIALLSYGSQSRSKRMSKEEEEKRREKNNWIKLFGNRTMRSFDNLFIVIGASVSHALYPPPPPKVRCTYKTVSGAMDRSRRLVNFK